MQDNNRIPKLHAATHKRDGTDQILLDELGIPTDVTLLNVTTSYHGLVPKLINDATKYLDSTGAYTVPAGGGGSGADHGARVRPSAASTNITSGAFTYFGFDAEEYDTDTFHDNATNNSRLTIPTTGKYLVTASATISPNINGVRVLDIVLNRTTDLAGQTANPGNNGGIYLSASAIWNFTAGDYVELGLYQDSGSTLTVAGGAGYLTHLAIQKIDKAG